MNGFCQVSPRDQDESLVMQEFLEVRTLNQIQIELPPCSAPIRMVPGGAAHLFVIVSQMHNHLVDAGWQSCQGLLVPVCPIRRSNARVYADDLLHQAL